MSERVKLTSESIQSLKDKFGVFHDAVIHHVSIPIFQPKPQRKIEVTLGARTRQEPPEYEYKWHNVHFQLYQPIFYQIRLRENHFLGVILSMTINVSNEGIFLDFFPYQAEIDNPSQHYREVFESGKGTFLIAAKEGYFTISDYEEYGESS